MKEGNSEDIIKKITKLLEDKDFADKMGKEGEKFIKQEFNWELVAKKFLETINPYLKIK